MTEHINSEQERELPKQQSSKRDGSKKHWGVCWESKLLVPQPADSDSVHLRLSTWINIFLVSDLVDSIIGGPWPLWESLQKATTGCGGQEWETLSGNQADWVDTLVNQESQRGYVPHVCERVHLEATRERSFTTEAEQNGCGVDNNGVAMATVICVSVGLRKVWVRKRWETCAEENTVWFIKGCWSCDSCFMSQTGRKKSKRPRMNSFQERLADKVLVDSWFVKRDLPFGFFFFLICSQSS